MATQGKETTQRYRYIVTQWTDWLDDYGLVCGFDILDEFDDRQQAITCAETAIERYIRDTLEPHVAKDWRPIERGSLTKPTVPNKFNNVIFGRWAESKGGLSRDTAKVEIIEVPYDTVIDERLFNTINKPFGDSEWEVSNALSEWSKRAKMSGGGSATDR